MILSDAELDRLEAAYPELATGKCVTCRGRGVYRWQGVQQTCDCAGQRSLFVRYARAGIGLTYQRMTWGDLSIPVPRDIVEYLDRAEDYIARGMGLFLFGPVGTGKTLLAMLILKDLVKAGYDCYTTTFAGMVENLIATWSDQDERARFTQRFMHSQVLCLDDLGKEIRNNFRDRLNPTTFDYILRPRVDNARPTIVTTNLSEAELRGYGDAVLSRLVESSIGVHLPGDDFRPLAYQRGRQELANDETRPLT